MVINSREELLAVPSGMLMIDRDGYAMTRTHEGEFALWSPDETRWKFYSPEEIDGTLVHEGRSCFFPIVCPDEIANTTYQGDSMTRFISKLQLGKLYKDSRTGIEGHCGVVAFQPHGCVEGVLEYMKDGEPKRMFVNELRLITPNGAELTETHVYETDLVQNHQYEDIETGIKGHLSIIEFHEFMATRGILRSVGTNKKGHDEVTYHSIDDFLLRDLSTNEVAEPKTEKKSPARSSVEAYRR